jgi:hypothetical protein
MKLKSNNNNNKKKIEEISNDDAMSKNKMNVFKNKYDNDYDNKSNISIENEFINKKQTNYKLLLSNNKSKINIADTKSKNPSKKVYKEEKIITPSLDFKKLKLKKSKVENDFDIALSSTRKMKSTDNDNLDIDELTDNLENNEWKDDSINNENTNSNKTEDSLIKNESKSKFTIEPEELFLKIISIDLNNKIINEELKLFLFNEIPKKETLISNINILYSEKNENNIIFNYNLEILRNSKIFYFAKIIKYFPQMKIRIYFSNNDNYSRVSNETDINTNYIYVGKIISNMMRTNFVVFKGNNENN